MKELLALPLVCLLPLLGKTQARGEILVERRGYLLAESEKQTVPSGHIPCVPIPLCKRTLHLFRREVNATRFPLERTQAFAFVRNLFEF